jgi:hypothetical protein
LKVCITPEEVDYLIQNQRKEIAIKYPQYRDLPDSEQKQQLGEEITDHRTCIKSAGRWKDYLQDKVAMEGRYDKESPPIYFDREEDSGEILEFPEGFFEDDTSIEEEVDKTVEESIKWYDKEVHYKPYEIEEINNKNLRAELLCKPDLKKIYKNWKYKIEKND